VTYGELTRRLRRCGIELDRQGGSHEVWRDPVSGQQTRIPWHLVEIPNGTLHSLLADLGLTLNDLRNA